MFVITKDLLNVEPGDHPLTGHMFNGNNSNACSHKFRLYDDDGLLYFEGRMHDNPLQSEGDISFEPLDTLQGDYGVTEMRVRKRGKWVTI